jgi:NTP pyrophosphatase (non-canonical NTP hydrolase)
MTFAEYQRAATKTAEYPDQGKNLLYPILGLVGESGEVADKVKKLWRNKGKTMPQQLDTQERHDLIMEVSDVMWYIAATCTELDISMEEVAQMNINKLNDRKARGVIKSEGDNR